MREPNQETPAKSDDWTREWKREKAARRRTQSSRRPLSSDLYATSLLFLLLLNYSYQIHLVFLCSVRWLCTTGGFLRSVPTAWPSEVSLLESNQHSPFPFFLSIAVFFSFFLCLFSVSRINGRIWIYFRT